MKMLSPNVTLWWVTDPSFDPNSPSAAKLNAALNLSQAVTSGYTLGPTKSDVATAQAITDSSKFETPTFINYAGKLKFFRESDQANTTSVYYQAFNTFKAGTANGASLTTGYIVRRVGMLSTITGQAGQVVESFKFIPDNPIDDATDKAEIFFEVNFQQQGSMGLFKTLLA